MEYYSFYRPLATEFFPGLEIRRKLKTTDRKSNLAIADLLHQILHGIDKIDNVHFMVAQSLG